MKRALLFLLLALVACRDQRPPGPTAEEDVRLNDADAMLNDAGETDQRP